MNWRVGSHCASKLKELSTTKIHPNHALDNAKFCLFHKIHSQTGLPSTAMLLQHKGLALHTAPPLDSQKTLISSAKLFWPKQCSFTVYRHYGHNIEKDPHLSRDFLSQLWVSDWKIYKAREKRRRRLLKHGSYGGSRFSFQRSLARLFSDPTVVDEKSYGQGTPPFKQLPISHSITGFLEPASPEEENRYGIVDVCYPQSPVGFIREQSNVIARQLLRLRRPFVAYISDALGIEIFRVRRPFWWINSSIYAEIDGKEIGVVHRRWHLWKRVYDLYLGNKQFAVVENPGFWNWTFTLKDIDGQVLAQIDRDWRGFGFEIFTDAGQYVIRFGSSDPSMKTGLASKIEELDVIRPLSLSERAVTLALAISLDNDYFSRHGGWGIPFVAVGE